MIDTNTLLSSLLRPGSTPSQAVAKAFREAVVLSSQESRSGLADGSMRDKFDPYISKVERKAYLDRVLPRRKSVDATELIHVCRDAGDNKLLSLAVQGKANILITGDRDLLVLNPFRGVDIVTAAEFIAL